VGFPRRILNRVKSVQLVEPRSATHDEFPGFDSRIRNLIALVPEGSDSRGETLTPRAGIGKAPLRNLWPLTKSYICAGRVLPSTLHGTRSSPSRSTQDYTPTLTNSSPFLFTMRCRRVV
jgi:hypothetical protein